MWLADRHSPISTHHLGGLPPFLTQGALRRRRHAAGRLAACEVRRSAAAPLARTPDAQQGTRCRCRWKKPPLRALGPWAGGRRRGAAARLRGRRRAAEPRGHCGGARHRREGLQRIVRFHQHSKHPGHRCRWARFSGVADYRDVCLATRGVPAEVGCRLRPACWAATRLQATMGTLIECKVVAFELQEDLCEHACSVGAVVLRLWAGRATGTAILRGGLRDAGAR